MRIRRLENIGRANPHVKLVSSVDELLGCQAAGGGGDRHSGFDAFSDHWPCLEAGMHVMVEKPLAASSDDGSR